MVNAQQRGTDTSLTRSQVIIPEYNFSCNGRITGYLISLNRNFFGAQDYPSVQVWHPTSSTVYTRVDTECPLTDSDISEMTDSGDEYYLGNVSCTGNNSIEFQSGDVIGYHQGFIRHRMRNIRPTGYTSLRIEDNNPLNTFDTNDVSNGNTFANIQPLIQVMFGKINIDNCNTYS